MKIIVEQRLRRLESQVRQRYCTHKEIMALRLPLWMRLQDIPSPSEISHLRESPPAIIPDPLKPTCGRCRVCGEWVELPTKQAETLVSE